MCSEIKTQNETELLFWYDACVVVDFFCPPDDLASKANIIIDPAEIQATSMDDLDEDEESGAAQVSGFYFHVFFVCIYFYIIHVPVPPGFLRPDFVTSLGCWDVLGTSELQK